MSLPLFTQFLERNGLEKKTYQYEGVEWCLHNETHSVEGMHGGFLADEMGLGKTFTILGVMECNPLPKTLIVLPAVLVDQWITQIKKTTTYKFLLYYGSTVSKITEEALNHAEVVVTTYHTIAWRFSSRKNESFLHKIHWDRIVFDEGHHLRNRKTLLWRSCMPLESKIRWIVSGTPIQNSKKDFYALCSLLRIPIEVYTDLDALKSIASSIILKRKKHEVGIFLPELKVVETSVPWDSLEEQELAENIHSMVGLTSSVDLDLFDPFNQFLASAKPIVTLLRAKQMCTLPFLLNHLLKRDESGYYTNAVKKSSKMDSVVSCLMERKDNGNGKLVFCHFHGEMDELVLRLKNGGIEDVVIMDGRTPIVERRKMLTEKHSVMVLQIQTGCEGLNLQDFFNEVYFVTPHWNPSVEEQAIARCYRIGQKKPVDVFRFLMKNFDGKPDGSYTLDSYVVGVQDKKKELIAGVV